MSIKIIIEYNLFLLYFIPMQINLDELVSKAKRVAAITGWSLSTIGGKAVANGRVFDIILEGGDIRTRTYNALDEWLDRELKK